VDVLALVHQDDAGAGVFADAVAAAGARLEQASIAMDRPPSRSPLEYDGVMVFGASANVDQTDEYPWLDDERRLMGELIERGRPLLGVCLGSQLLAEVAGGSVGPLPGGPEIGWKDVTLTEAAADDPVLGALPHEFLALEWHHYGAASAPPGSVELATGDAGLQAFRVDGAPAWGIQFHAEVDAATLERWTREDDREFTDPAALRASTAMELDRWNQLGRRLAGAFIEAARR
jgi:GMP synthase (glutamine-hydrolysing)